MKVRYAGPSGSGVDVVHPDPQAPDANTVTHCPLGEPVDLPDDVALAQMTTGVFEPADTKAERALATRQRQIAATTDETPAEPGTQED